MPQTIPMPTKSELETPRPAKDLLPWAVQRIKEIGATPEGKSILRLNQDRMVKMLSEEVLPMGIFAQHLAADATVQPIDGNQNYDAVVDGDPVIRHIEVTQAHEGQLDHFRMLILERNGRVGSFDEITNVGGVLTSEPRAKSHHEVIDDELTRIHEAVQRKSSKQYPANTALVVAFEDFPTIAEERDHNLLDQFVTNRAIGEASQFCVLGLVGWVKHLYWIYQASNCPPCGEPATIKLLDGWSYPTNAHQCPEFGAEVVRWKRATRGKGAYDVEIAGGERREVWV